MLYRFDLSLGSLVYSVVIKKEYIILRGYEKNEVYSKPVILCMDYIYNHLHETIHVDTLAKVVGLNRSYLSTLFKKEMGTSVSEYIVSKRMEVAKNMLRFSDYTYAEISAILAFSSQSHFNRVFRAKTGYTPKEFRNHFFRISQEENK